MTNGTGSPSRTAPWGPSLKPFLDLYYLLSGSGLQDLFKNSSVTYKTYTVEQQRIFQNYIFTHPKRERSGANIEKYCRGRPATSRNTRMNG